jgi:hypothetical protein
MLVCGRCRGDGRERWLGVFRRTCRACEGAGAVGPADGRFGNLAQPRPAPVRTIDSPDISTPPSMASGDVCIGVSCDSGDGGGDVGGGDFGVD